MTIPQLGCSGPPAQRERVGVGPEPGCNYDWAGFQAELNLFSLRWRAGLRAMASAAPSG